MITALIVVALCYIIPTILMLLFFKYTEIGKTASDDAVLCSIIPIVNILYMIGAAMFLISDLIERPLKSTLVDSFKRRVLKFARGN